MPGQCDDSNRHLPKENGELPQSCRKCLKQISPNDYVINISKQASCLYHLNCFSCSDCSQLLSPGSPYGIYNEHVYCTQHYHSQLSVPASLPQYTMLESIGNNSHHASFLHQQPTHTHPNMSKCYISAFTWTV